MNHATRSVGFWSYTRRDDDLEGGRILRLANKIQSEYELITGEELKLFIDKENVEWGDEWRRVTNAALVETAFFIPIITPKYLQSEECRREFIEFIGRATSVGARDLVLPIVYIDTPAVNDADTTDEVARLVRETQRQDWRSLRLASEDSEQYRTAVNKLAQRLADITSEMSERPLPPADSGTGKDEENGALDDVAQAEEAIQSWAKILDELGEEMQALTPVATKTTERLQASDRRGGSRAKIKILADFAREIERPSERIYELGTAFGRTAVEANPGVIAAIEMAKSARNTPEETAEAEDFIITVQSLVDMSEGIATVLREFVTGVEGAESVSRVVRTPLRRMRNGLAAILDALTVLDGWASLAGEARDNRQ